MSDEEINLVMGPDGELHTWEFKTTRDTPNVAFFGARTGRFKVNHPPMHFWMRGDPLGCVEPDDEGVYKITTMEGRA